MSPRGLSPCFIALVVLAQAVAVGHCHGCAAEHEPRPHLHVVWLETNCTCSDEDTDGDKTNCPEAEWILILPLSLTQGFLHATNPMDPAPHDAFWFVLPTAFSPTNVQTIVSRSGWHHDKPPWPAQPTVLKLQI